MDLRTMDWYMKKLNLNQSLLLKSCFLNNGSDYFRKWLSIFNPSDLDYYTRAIISILLNSISIEKISPELNKKMIIYKQQTWFLNCRKWQKIKSILSDFTDAKIECCLLKGAAMVLFYYDDLSQRPENADIDILIKKENLTLAIEILKKHGFVPQKAFFWDANDLESQVLKQGSVLSKLHAIHYLKDGLVIDLHWNLSPIIKNITYEKLEKSMLSTNKFGIKLYYLCPEMQLVHLAIHSLFQDIKSKSINSTIDFCYFLSHTHYYKVVIIEKSFYAFYT